jgi:quinol monooxygenase YgiN
MSEVVVMVVAQAKPGRGEDALARFQALAVQTHAEEGCRLFALHRAAGDPERIVLVERWASRAALDEHLSAPYLLEFRRTGADLWAVPTQIMALDAAPCGDPIKGALAGG